MSITNDNLAFIKLLLLRTIIGTAGEITGPLAAFPGAAILVWCGRRGWDKTVQGAICQTYILAMQFLAFLSLNAATARAPFNPGVLVYALPGAVGAYLGSNVFKRLTDVQFQRLVNLALVVSGVVLLLR